MAIEINKEFFVPLAEEIAELASFVYGKTYSPELVEIGATLVDYHDGYAYHLVIRALLRDPVDDIYNLIVDVLGTPEEALVSLKETLLKKAGPSFEESKKVKSLNVN